MYPPQFSTLKSQIFSTHEKWNVTISLHFPIMTLVKLTVGMNPPCWRIKNPAVLSIFIMIPKKEARNTVEKGRLFWVLLCRPSYVTNTLGWKGSQCFLRFGSPSLQYTPMISKLKLHHLDVKYALLHLITAWAGFPQVHTDRKYNLLTTFDLQRLEDPFSNIQVISRKMHHSQLPKTVAWIFQKTSLI